MELTMRELRGDDLFPLIHIFGKIGITDEIVELYSAPEKVDIKDKSELEKFVQARGYKVIGRLLNKVMLNLPLVKDDLNTFLAELCGVSPKEVSELGLIEKTELIKAFFKKPELLGFFKSIASFMR